MTQIMESKAYRLGTHRALNPSDTLKRVQPLLGQMGITRVANVTGLDRVGIPVYTSFRPTSRSISVSQGKGIERDAAKVSAIMESVETYHAERITKPLRYGSVNELTELIPLANINNLAKACDEALPVNTPVYWIEGENLFDHRALWLPFEIVSTDYTLPYMNGNGYFAANTNGLASGNTLSEATCHALYEVVERDAEALWNQQSSRLQSATGIDLNSIEDQNCQWLIEKFNNAQVEIKIWDMTSDIGLPCFICLAMGDDNDWADPEFGAGCHGSKEVALSRALTEAAQARATYIAGSRDDVGLSEYQQKTRENRRIQGRKQMHNHQNAKKFNQIKSYEKEDIYEDLQVCLEKLTQIGIDQVVLIDLSKPEFGLAVVKTAIPGLEGAYGHWHSSYTPGARAKSAMNLPFDFK